MVKIATDSCCDLTVELLKENNIAVLPLLVSLGEDDYFDGVNVSPDDIYEFVKNTKQLPKTAARSTEDFKEFFSNLLEDGSEVVYTGIGSNLSCTYENAKRAKEELGSDRLFVVDSKSLSTGIGLLVLFASNLAKQGKNGEQIVDQMKKQAENSQASFVVNKLDYLHKGGRCSAMAKFGANLLKIKPRLELVDGKIENTGKYMGQFKSVLLKYVDDMLNAHPNPKKDICFVTHTKTEKEIVDAVIEHIKSKNIFDRIVETTAGSTITCHCGENTLGMLFLTEME